jgi:hypothetical protein
MSNFYAFRQQYKIQSKKSDFVDIYCLTNNVCNRSNFRSISLSMKIFILKFQCQCQQSTDVICLCRYHRSALGMSLHQADKTKNSYLS